jgi:hypothetical protein
MRQVIGSQYLPKSAPADLGGFGRNATNWRISVSSCSKIRFSIAKQRLEHVQFSMKTEHAPACCIDRIFGRKTGFHFS